MTYTIAQQRVNAYKSGVIADDEVTAPASAPSPLRVAVAQRDFRLLMTSLASSTVADWFYSVAIVVLVFERTDSAAWVAGVSIARIVPFVALGPLAGELADRVDRRKLILQVDVVRALLMTGLAVVSAAGSSPAAILVFAFAAAVAGTPYAPAVTALTPALVPERSLAAANSLTASVNYMALVIGPALGALMMTFTSPALAFGVVAGCFALSATAIAAMRPRAVRRPAPHAIGIVRRTIEGFRPILRSGETIVLAGFWVGQAFLYGIESVLLVLAADSLFDMGSVGFGWLLTAVGLGGLAAALLAGRLAELRRPAIILIASVTAVGVPIALMSAVRLEWIAYGILLFDGAGTLVTEVLAITALQRSLREHEIAKAFAAMDAAAFGGVLLGALAAPILVEALGLQAALIVGGLSVPVLAIATSPVLRAVDRRAQERLTALAPTMQVLGRSPIFDGAGPAALEMLAATLTGSTAAPGQTVISLGEEASQFFVVVEGRLEVVEASGSVVAALGPGDHFGEIGILEGRPRTASVRAVTEAKLFCISADDFLGVINKSPTLHGALREGLARTLSRPAAGN